MKSKRSVLFINSYKSRALSIFLFLLSVYFPALSQDIVYSEKGVSFEVNVKLAKSWKNSAGEQRYYWEINLSIKNSNNVDVIVPHAYIEIPLNCWKIDGLTCDNSVARGWMSPTTIPANSLLPYNSCWTSVCDYFTPGWQMGAWRFVETKEQPSSGNSTQNNGNGYTSEYGKIGSFKGVDVFTKWTKECRDCNEYLSLKFKNTNTVTKDMWYKMVWKSKGSDDIISDYGVRSRRINARSETPGDIVINLPKGYSREKINFSILDWFVCDMNEDCRRKPNTEKEKTVGSSPGNNSYQNPTYITHRDAGIKYYNSGNYEEALRQYNQALIYAKSTAEKTEVNNRINEVNRKIQEKEQKEAYTKTSNEFQKYLYEGIERESTGDYQGALTYYNLAHSKAQTAAEREEINGLIQTTKLSAEKKAKEEEERRNYEIQERELENFNQKKQQKESSVAQNQVAAAGIVTTIASVAAMGIASNNEDNEYKEEATMLGLGLGLNAEYFPMIVDNNLSLYNNGTLNLDNNYKEIHTDGTIGIIGDVKFSPYVFKGYTPKFKISGGFNIAIGSLLNSDVENVTTVSSSTMAFYKVNFLNYFGGGGLKLILSGEVEKKYINSYEETTIIGTSGSSTNRSVSTYQGEFNTDIYRWGGGISFGSPDNLNFDILFEKGVFSSPDFSNYRLSVHVWQSSIFNLQVSASTFNQYYNTPSYSGELTDKYKNKVIFQVSLLYNKDWFWSKKYRK